MTIPTAEDWLNAFEAAPSLAGDAELLEHVRQRFHSKYLETIMRARNDVAADRAWGGVLFLDGVSGRRTASRLRFRLKRRAGWLESLKPLVARLREGLREQQANQA